MKEWSEGRLSAFVQVLEHVKSAAHARLGEDHIVKLCETFVKTAEESLTKKEQAEKVQA